MSTKKSSQQSVRKIPAAVVKSNAVDSTESYVLRHHAHVIQHDIGNSPPLKLRIKTDSFNPEDVHEFIFAEGGIDEVRELQSRVYLKPRGEKALYLAAFGVLSNQAQNALLKLLEDPPSHAFIVLGVATPRTLLPTILSRVQVLDTQTRTSALHTDAKELLSASLPQRLILLEPYIESKNIEQICTLIETVHTEVMKEYSSESAVLLDQTRATTQTISYIRMQGALVKMLLEAWVLTLPRR